MLHVHISGCVVSRRLRHTRGANVSTFVTARQAKARLTSLRWGELYYRSSRIVFLWSWRERELRFSQWRASAHGGCHLFMSSTSISVGESACGQDVQRPPGAAPYWTLSSPMGFGPWKRDLKRKARCSHMGIDQFEGCFDKGFRPF